MRFPTPSTWAVTLLVMSMVLSISPVAQASSRAPSASRGADHLVAGSEARETALRPAVRSVSKILNPRKGGTVRLGKAKLRVPAGAMSKRGRVSVTALPGGRYDMHVAVPWSGSVQVTLPPKSKSHVLMHEIDGVMLPEGKPGQRSVVVSQLSIFSWVKDKLKAAACVASLSKAKIVTCLTEKLGNSVSKEVGMWIAQKLGANCYATLAVAGLFGGPGSIFMSAFTDPACMGTASSPGVPPSTPTQPTPNQPSPSPQTERTIVVDNRVTNGGAAMREDKPAYLSTVTRNFCRANGCMVSGTDLGSGNQIIATCTSFGDRTTNGQDNSAIDDQNPGLYSSTRWYGIRWGDGRFGYVSEVWIAGAYRGGLGLRGC